MKVSSGEYDKAQGVNGMIMRESNGESDRTSRSRNQRKSTRNGFSKARAQASTPYKSLPSLSALQGDIFEKNGLREKLKAVPSSILKFFSAPEHGHER